MQHVELEQNGVAAARAASGFSRQARAAHDAAGRLRATRYQCITADTMSKEFLARTAVRNGSLKVGGDGECYRRCASPGQRAARVCDNGAGAIALSRPDILASSHRLARRPNPRSSASVKRLSGAVVAVKRRRGGRCGSEAAMAASCARRLQRKPANAAATLQPSRHRPRPLYPYARLRKAFTCAT
jgi:hypothetical protein